MLYQKKINFLFLKINYIDYIILILISFLFVFIAKKENIKLCVLNIFNIKVRHIYNFYVPVWSLHDT